MRAQIYISGSVVWEGKLDTVPPVGTSIIFPMQTYKKGLRPGTILRFDVSSEFPPTVDLTEEMPVLSLDVDGWRVLAEGPISSSDESDDETLEAADQRDADESYEAALRALSDKSTDPSHPNFDAGLATIRHAHTDKFGTDPEQP